MKHPRFELPSAQDFIHDVRREAQAWLDQRSDHRFADRWLIAKGAALVAGMALAYAAMLGADGLAAFAAADIAFIWLAMMLAVNVLHDVAHGAMFRSRTLNRIAMRLFMLPLGIDADYWITRHVHFHHSHANVEGSDLDIEPNAFLRQTPSQPWRAHFRHQHRYWLLVAALSLPWVNWVFDWSDRLGRTPLREERSMRGLRGWALFVGAKAAHFAIALALPAWWLHDRGVDVGVAQVLVVCMVGQMLASTFLVASLLGTHWVDAEFFVAPADGRLRHTWFEHAFRTSVDWTPRPRVLGYWMGGLNLHLTHHLFPTVSHRHYPALARIVQRVAARHGLRYRALGYRDLWQAQQRFLRAMGERPAGGGH